MDITTQNIIPSFLQLKYAGVQFADRILGRKSVDKWTNTRSNIHDNIEQFFEKKGREGRLIKLPKVEVNSYKEFKKKYLNTYTPIILKGLAKDWNCCKNWSLDYFKELHGDDEIVMMDYSDFNNGYQRTYLRDIIEGIRSGMGKYYRFYPLLTRHPEHIADFDYKWLRNCKQKDTLAEAFQVFIGGEGTGTPLHNSICPNLFVQVFGKKTWRIFSPHYTTIVDPKPACNLHRDAPTRNNKVFDPFNPDYETFPLYKYIDMYEADLEPGDVLWNPPYYWHAVQNPTDCIGVGYRWVPLWFSFKASPNYFLLDLITKQPNFIATINYFKKDTNLIHLAETNHIDKYLKEEKERKLSKS